MKSRTKTALFGVVAFAAAAVCVRLGIWQLDRLDQRQARNAIIRERSEAAPVSISALQGQDTTRTHWRRVHLRGIADYRGEAVLAARSQSGSPGIYLLTPVRPLDGAWGDTATLLLRGYVYSPDGRTIDFKKAEEGDTIDVDALITSFPVPKPGTVRLPSSSRAVRVLDRDTLAAVTGHPLAPFVLLALGDTVVHDVTLPARVPPPPLNEGPHLSYALQWFGFATVFVVGFIVFARGPRRYRE
jgi:surfeit locus 1 family protein